ncbi:MAG: hypothetical protein JAZ19_08730 [Candidatus Thiodiazotropha taylori]|nr:hypothetical protein [Candidatus Thiodiazotropha taylori]
MGNKSKEPNELSKAVENMLSAMEEEAMQRSQKDQALLDELSSDTYNVQPEGSNTSEQGDTAYQRLKKAQEATGKDIKLRSLMDDLKKEYPGLTEEKIRGMGLYLV